MGTLEKELADLDAEFTKRRAGLLAASGRIAEAESLAEAINEKIADEYYTSAAPVVTSHHDGEVKVRVLIMNNHARVRAAIQTLGLNVNSEISGEPGAMVTSSIHLGDFIVQIDMYCEPTVIAEAA